MLWVRFQSLDEAKAAKKRWDDSSFYAHPLHITYAPEYVTAFVLRSLFLSSYSFTYFLSFTAIAQFALPS